MTDLQDDHDLEGIRVSIDGTPWTLEDSPVAVGSRRDDGCYPLPHPPGVYFVSQGESDIRFLRTDKPLRAILRMKESELAQLLNAATKLMLPHSVDSDLSHFL